MEGLIACCVSGLGPTDIENNTALGIWYFNGVPLPYGLCEDPVINVIQSRITGLMNFVRVLLCSELKPNGERFPLQQC